MSHTRMRIPSSPFRSWTNSSASTSSGTWNFIGPLTRSTFVAQQSDQVRARLNQTEEELKQLKAKAGILSLTESTTNINSELTRSQGGVACRGNRICRAASRHRGDGELNCRTKEEHCQACSRKQTRLSSSSIVLYFPNCLNCDRRSLTGFPAESCRAARRHARRRQQSRRELSANPKSGFVDAGTTYPSGRQRICRHPTERMR